MRGTAIDAGSGVTRPTHRDESLGLRNGTGRMKRWGSPATLGVGLHHLGVGDHVGTADLDHAIDGLGILERRSEVVEDVANRNRLTLRAHPAGCDHRRKHLGEVAQHLERDRPRPDDHRCSELGGRRAARGEDLAHLVAARQMRGECVAASHAAEIHDAAAPGGVGGVARIQRGDRFGRGEVAAGADGVDEVADRVAPFEGRSEGAGIEHVPDEQPDAA